MAEVLLTAENGGADGGERRDVKSILSADGRDFLVRNDGDQVPVLQLEGKIVGLYLCVSSYGSCTKLHSNAVHKELKEKRGEF